MALFGCRDGGDESDLSQWWSLKLTGQEESKSETCWEHVVNMSGMLY